MAKTHLIIFQGEEEVFNRVVTDLHPQCIEHYIEFEKRRLTVEGFQATTLRRRIIDVSTKPPASDDEIMKVTVWTVVGEND